MAEIIALGRQQQSALAPNLVRKNELNRLYYGDNLTVLRNDIPSESVDLVYLDPPFNSQANYNVLFKSPAGEKAHAQIENCGGGGGS